MTAAINRLSVLTGEVPDALHHVLSSIQSLPSLPSSVGVGDVEQLLKRRPDIIRAQAKMNAAIAHYNLAAADQFPAVNLLGSISFFATDWSTFGKRSSLTGAIGPSLSWGILDFGRINARIDQNDAKAKVASISYELTILRALEETQTAISDFAKEEQRRTKLQTAAGASVNASLNAKQRFELGDTDFLPVLDSERVQLEAEDALAVSEIQAALYLVKIYKALAPRANRMPIASINL